MSLCGVPFLSVSFGLVTMHVRVRCIIHGRWVSALSGRVNGLASRETNCIENPKVEEQVCNVCLEITNMAV